MKDFTAKEKIFLLDIMIGNMWLFLDRTPLLSLNPIYYAPSNDMSPRLVRTVIFNLASNTGALTEGAWNLKVVLPDQSCFFDVPGI